MDLFDRAAAAEAEARAPLAERMRPRTLEEYLGQEHLTAQGRLLPEPMISYAGAAAAGLGGIRP